MNLQEAKSFLEHNATRPTGHLASVWDKAKGIVEAHEREEAVKAADAKAAADWQALPFYMKWWYSILNWLFEPAWWVIPRGVFVLVAFVVVGFLFFGGRNVVRNLTAEPPATEAPMADPSLLLQQPQVALTTAPVVDPSLLLQPTAAPAGDVVECTVQTCPDATPYRVDYQGNSGPKGSGTLKAQCLPKDSKEKSPVLGEVPQGTIVWVKTATIQPGKFCENGECRIGMIYPVAGFPNGGCISFTALHPVNP